MNRLLVTASLLAAAMALSTAAGAQNSANSAASAAQAPVPKDFAQGEVRKVDKAGKTITLQHGEIRNLGMPPMAMVFEVKDPRLLDNFKPGDKVRFKAVHEAGNYVVVDLRPAK